MTCNCPGNICTCDGTPKLKDVATFHLPLMLKDSAMATDPKTKLTIAEKRAAVAKAYGEAAVKRLAEGGAKTAEYKAAYAESAGEIFIGQKDDKFIEGFFESLQAGKTPDEIAEQANQPKDGATVDAMPTADMSLEDAVKLPRYAGMWPSQAQQFAARDLAMAKMGTRGSLAYQMGIRDAYAERQSNAWKGAGGNETAPTEPLYAKDGRTFDKLSDSEKARERMAHRQSEAWKH
jgi:hypothetical protein